MKGAQDGRLSVGARIVQAQARQVHRTPVQALAIAMLLVRMISIPSEAQQQHLLREQRPRSELVVVAMMILILLEGGVMLVQVHQARTKVATATIWSCFLLVQATRNAAKAEAKAKAKARERYQEAVHLRPRWHRARMKMSMICLQTAAPLRQTETRTVTQIYLLGAMPWETQGPNFQGQCMQHQGQLQAAQERLYPALEA